MLALAALCVAAAWFPAEPGRWLGAAVSGLAPAAAAGEAARALLPLGPLALAVGIVVAFLLVVRAVVMRGRVPRTAETWGCGYAHPSAAIQYTAASLAEPIARVFAPALRLRVERADPSMPWPARAAFGYRVPDLVLDGVVRPGYAALLGLLGRLRGLQEPRVTTYVGYVALALLALVALLFLPVGRHP
jgi:hypothetical protein